MLIEVILILGLFPSNSSNNYGNSYGNQSYNNRKTSDLENNIKEFINTQKVFNTSIEEKLSKMMICLEVLIELLMMWKIT